MMVTGERDVRDHSFITRAGKVRVCRLDGNSGERCKGAVIYYLLWGIRV